MLTWIKIAYRSLLKNRRRSFFTILAIGLGFAAVNVFGGFTDYIFSSMEEGFIYGQANGHLTLYKQGFRTSGRLDPAGFLLMPDEVARIEEVLRTFPDVDLVTPGLNITGLLTKDELSTIFIGTGRIPSEVSAINKKGKGVIAKLDADYRGRPLEDGALHGIGVSAGLAELLDLDIDSDAIAVAPTVDGQINALDAQIFQIFESSIEILNDKLIAVPLTFAQSLYDTQGVDRLIILLQDSSRTAAVRDALRDALTRQGLAVEIATWDELSPFYAKIRNMFDIIFLFIFLIVFIIAMMSVINTIGMTVMERIQEIGTLRALGVKRAGIANLFAVESAILGLVGCLFGIVLTVGCWELMRVLDITWTPPIFNRAVPLEINLVPSYMALSLAVLLVLSIGAASLPARRAARLNIVDALGHV